MKTIFAAALAVAIIMGSDADAEDLAYCDQAAVQLTVAQIRSCIALDVVEDAVRAQIAAENNEAPKSVIPHRDARAISLCPSPHRMTSDGCK